VKERLPAYQPLKACQRCGGSLQQVPAPEIPDIALIFNPEGISNRELEKLAKLGTVEALDKLRQALDGYGKKCNTTKMVVVLW
jgi:hypothetical protein